jgi:plasmid stabilization system protein ParE
LKPLKIIRAGEAVLNIADIHLFITVENPEAAERFLVALRASFRTLAQWPQIGPRQQSNRVELAGLRFWPVRRFTNYLIFYRVIESPAGCTSSAFFTVRGMFRKCWIEAAR